MMWIQRSISLSPRSRGFHLITDEVLSALPETRQIQTGVLHVFIQHTSASLTINENADPDVPLDLESAFSALAPERREAPLGHLARHLPVRASPTGRKSTPSDHALWRADSILAARNRETAPRRLMGQPGRLG
jgi:hypothetical protein